MPAPTLSRPALSSRRPNSDAPADDRPPRVPRVWCAAVHASRGLVWGGERVMSIASDCYGCVMGEHEKHHRDWNITPGLIGGAYCGCEGDCAKRSKEAFDRWWGSTTPAILAATLTNPEPEPTEEPS